MVQLAAFEVADGGMVLHGVVFEVDDAGVAVARRRSCSRRRRTRRRARRKSGLADPPVEVDDLGLVFLDDLGVAGEPVVAVQASLT